MLPIVPFALFLQIFQEIFQAQPSLLHCLLSLLGPVAFNLVFRVGHRREVCRGLTGDTALCLARYF